jgi:tRNA A-37 threonylcarbamoyl transferase component Bud32
MQVSACITKVIKPFTLSSVMVVLLDYPDLGLEGHMILKLYDRRFAPGLRECEGIPPWTFQIEQEYQKFILDGGASDFITKLRSNSNLAETEGEYWCDVEYEAYLYDQMQKFYDTETKVYQRIKDMQGRDVPRLIARITVSPDSPSPTQKCLDCSGILLELIEGFPLGDIVVHAPRETWQGICEEAIYIVNTIGDRDIRNQDVKTRNFIVRRDPVEEKFKVFMIDFALCEFRREDQDEEDWRMWKALEDEEGAVGYVMQSHCKEAFVYRRSAQYLRLDHDFMSEENDVCAMPQGSSISYWNCVNSICSVFKTALSCIY